MSGRIQFGWLRALSCTLQAEREWYEQEEGGTVDETHDPFVGDDKLFDKRAAEMQKKMVRPALSTDLLLMCTCCSRPAPACDHITF